MRVANKIAIVAILLLAVAAAHAETRRSAGTQEAVRHSTMSIAAVHPVATMLVTLPPQEKPKTHWPWWLRLLAVVGVLVFIRLVAGSVRNNPGRPGPN